jgi:galactokinase
VHPNLRPVVDRAIDRYRAWAGRDPSAVACAPGRVNLIGEHTDYNDGFVLPMAIDRWCVAAGSLGAARVLSDDLGQSVEYDIDHPDAAAFPDASWARYPVGVVWKMRDRIGAGRWRGSSGVEMALSSGVPVGSGLSSSASLELAAAGLVNQVFGLGLPPTELADLGRAAEHEFAGVPCGIMDQLISACAEPGAAMLIDCRTRELRPVPLPNGRNCVVVIAHCGKGHALASGEYARRRESCRRATQALGVAALRDADAARLESHANRLLPADVDCARHIISENARVLRFANAMEAGDLGRAGELMYASHESLRAQYRVSCSELDALVAAAKNVSGVFGSRMTGGGFGGCTVSLCRPEAADELCEALGRTAKSVGRPPIEPFVATPVGGAMSWELPV